MKVLILGATGKVGRHLVKQALEQGHDVTAFVRSPEKLGPLREKLRLAKGDVLDIGSLVAATRGQDCVLCALGMPLLNKEGLRATATANIIQAMEEVGVRRLVCLSALGTGDSADLLPFRYKFILVPLLMRHLYADHGLQESHIRQSDLDWVIARPANFVEGKRTGEYRHGFTAADDAPTLKISTADVADFMLKQMDDDTYLRRAPALSY